MFQSVKSKNIYWKYLLLKTKHIFLRDSYVCPICIFIFDSDQAQINSVALSNAFQSLGSNLYLNSQCGKLLDSD